MMSIDIFHQFLAFHLWSYYINVLRFVGILTSKYKVSGGGGCAQFNFSEIKTKDILFTGGKNKQNIIKPFKKIVIL